MAERERRPEEKGSARDMLAEQIGCERLPGAKMEYRLQRGTPQTDWIPVKDSFKDCF